MKNKIPYKLSIAAAVFLAIFNYSCTKEEINMSDLNDTIFVRHENADMPAYIHGNGSEKVFLIILHGGPGGTGISYRANTIRTEIERNNAVVYFDQRGSGSSQGSYTEEDVSIDLMADDVLALAKVIREKYGEDSKLFLMGHSWGGTLGPAVLLKNQTAFIGWIDVDGAHNHAALFDAYRSILPQTANEQIAIGNSVEYWEGVIDDVQDIGSIWSINNHLALNNVANSVDDVLAEDDIINKSTLELSNDYPNPNLLIALWNNNLIGHILDYNEGLNEVSYTDQLSEITIPSLVLWGEHDHTIPVEFAYEAYDNMGSTEKEIYIFNRSGHNPHRTQPDIFSDKVIDFVNTHK